MSATGWQLSTGDFSELLRPASYVLATLASALLLAQLRRRRFHTLPTLALALVLFLLTFLFPLVLLPLLLAAWILSRRDARPDTSNEVDAALTVEMHAGESLLAGEPSQDGETRVGSTLKLTKSEDALVKRGLSEEETDAGQVSSPLKNTAARHRWNIALSLLYAAIMLACGAYFFARDYQSFDAHLARAHRAKLYGREEQTIREYRAALQLEDDAHTRKLLGLELKAAGRTDEALTQFLAAEHGGEPDSMLAYYIAATFDLLGRPADAAFKYQEFLRSPLCTQTRPDVFCQAAQARLQKHTDTASPPN